MKQQQEVFRSLEGLIAADPGTTTFSTRSLLSPSEMLFG